MMLANVPVLLAIEFNHYEGDGFVALFNANKKSGDTVWGMTDINIIYNSCLKYHTLRLTHLSMFIQLLRIGIPV